MASGPRSPQHRSSRSSSNNSLDFVRPVFKSMGEYCACQPWAVIIGIGIILVCFTGVAFNGTATAEDNNSITSSSSTCSSVVQDNNDCNNNQEAKSSHWAMSEVTEQLILFAGQCLSVFHIGYRMKVAHRTGSSLIFLTALGYLAVTFLLYAIVAVSLHASADYFRIVQESWYIFLLLVDVPKVTRMAQFALSSSHKARLSENVGHGMSVLGQTFVLDTMGKILLFGVCQLTGVPQLINCAWYSLLINMVNLLVYFTFYPSALCLGVELMYCSDGHPRWDVRKIINTLPREDSQSPVVHKGKVLGAAFLFILHTLCHWPIVFHWSIGFQGLILANICQTVVVGAVIALSCWSLFGDGLDEAKELRRTYVEELDRQCVKGSEDSEENFELDRASSTDEGIFSLSGTTNAQLNRPRGQTAVTQISQGSGSNSDSSSESAWSFSDDLYMYKKQQQQTADSSVSGSENEMRPLEECVKIMRSHPDGVAQLTDDEVVQLVESKHVRGHMLEKVLNNHLRGVQIRRKYLARQDHIHTADLSKVPYRDYDYELVMGACAESVIGYMTIPLGTVGPLKLDGKYYTVPMATTEGCLVASTNRGCSALSATPLGVTSVLYNDGMSRAPVVCFRSIVQACQAKEWMDDEEHFKIMKEHFDSTSRFARLRRVKPTVAGRHLYIRFVASTGDAMGMNMLSKATEFTLKRLREDVFPDMQVLSLSGNMCTDKKPSAVNWVDGRGKSVVCEATIPAEIVEKTLKTSTAALVDLNINKNLTGSAMAGSIGGFNAHAANIVTAIFIATGQDVAQTVGSSNCITQMEATGEAGRDLYISVTMPSIEVGTVGGGTVLAAQSQCLAMLGVKGSHPTSPGDNSRQLAQIICATVLAGELSLMSALAAGHLVQSHLRHNRSSVAINSLAMANATLTHVASFSAASDDTICSDVADIVELQRSLKQRGKRNAE